MKDNRNASRSRLGTICSWALKQIREVFRIVNILNLSKLALFTRLNHDACVYIQFYLWVYIWV